MDNTTVTTTNYFTLMHASYIKHNKHTYPYINNINFETSLQMNKNQCN